MSLFGESNSFDNVFCFLLSNGYTVESILRIIKGKI